MTMPATSRRVLEFTQHNYLAILATVYPSGGPQAFPVWYEYDGQRFTIATDADTAKVRNIRRNPQVALCITDTSHQVKSLTVRGRAVVVMDNRHGPGAAPQAVHPLPWPKGGVGLGRLHVG